MFHVFTQSVLVYEILKYTEKPDGSTLTHGVGLCVALFCSEFCKAFFISLMWAVNLRTAIRVKNAFSMLAFSKIISLRVVNSISVGEVVWKLGYCQYISICKVLDQLIHLIPGSFVHIR